VNTSFTGGATAFSNIASPATVTLKVNQLTAAPAPAWVGSGATLTPVVPGVTSQGDTVAHVFGKYFADSNATTVGIAVSGVSGTKLGQWLYSIDGGTTWQSMSSVTASAAVLLAGNDLIRFLPNTGYLGTATLTAHAWDGTGKVGSVVNLTLKHATGGTTHFSATTLTATCLVNTAPTLGA